MAGSFLSLLDLALLPASLSAWDAVVFIRAGESDGLLMACLYGLPGIILNSRKLQFLSFHMRVGSGSTRLSHAQACESLYSLSTEHNSPSDWRYGITPFILFPPLLSEASDLGPYCICSSCPTANSTLYLNHLPLPFMHLPWHLAIRPRHTARLWELTKLLPVNWLPANLLLGSSWLCESSYPAAQLFHRGRYGWTRTPVQRQLHKLRGYCLHIGSWSLLPPSIIWSISHTSSGARISTWFGGLGIHEPVRLAEVCSVLMSVCVHGQIVLLPVCKLVEGEIASCSIYRGLA